MIFSATQRYNIVFTLFRMAAILFQHFNPFVALRIVVANRPVLYTRRFSEHHLQVCK